MKSSYRSGEGRNPEGKENKLWSPVFVGMAFVAGFFLVSCFSPKPAMASTNMIVSVTPASTSWGWNDLVGWINFNAYSNITVYANQMTGYASSSVGPVSLDCGTSPIGNICAAIPYGVTNSTTSVGILSGWAWNTQIGWIIFNWKRYQPGVLQQLMRLELQRVYRPTRECSMARVERS